MVWNTSAVLDLLLPTSYTHLLAKQGKLRTILGFPRNEYQYQFHQNFPHGKS